MFAAWRVVGSLVILGALAPGCACAHRETTALPVQRVPIVFIALSNDDGTREARFEPSQLATWVRFTNSVFESAGIRFDFDPQAVVLRRRNTRLNELPPGGGDAWPRSKAIGNALAAEHPGSVVVLLRHGPGERATGTGFGAVDYAFVAGAGTEDTDHCGTRHDDFLAHEIGHYLGLAHTFRGDPFADVAAAEAHFTAHGRDPAMFDGDGLADTAPDPAIRTLECKSVERITLAGVTFSLPRQNVMTYYRERDSLSPLQRRTVRWVLERRLAAGGSMQLPVNRPPGDAVEAEGMRIDSRHEVSESTQAMGTFGIGDWSGNAQLFARAGGVGGEVTLAFETASRVERPVLYATLAPDFARVQVLVDGRAAGKPVDLWAPCVVPSGPIALAIEGRPRALEPGEHRLTIRVVGRNEAATGWAFGIDAIGAAPSTP